MVCMWFVCGNLDVFPHVDVCERIVRTEREFSCLSLSYYQTLRHHPVTHKMSRSTFVLLSGELMWSNDCSNLLRHSVL